MKIKYLPLTIALMLFAIAANCQSQLYFENFEGASTIFTLNDTSLGSNKGNNKWIIDTNYFAGGIYPKTINENNTYGGTITYAPYGHYLHIYDSASGYLNDLYNPNDSSTRFVHTTTGTCTKALTNINFNFFYLCPSIKNYGTVWYSIDGGPWTQTGDTLRNRVKWQYHTITNPVFSNVEDLRFGFLWHNNQSAGGHDTTSLGIDDVSLYGTYDSINHPITCKFTTLYYDSCLGGDGTVYFEARLSDSTCDAGWKIDMSNGNGSGFSGYAWSGDIGPDYFNDITSYWYLQIPAAFVTPGECYRFTLSRSAYPYISFTDSFCFPLDSCPGFITTLQPPSTLPSGDTTCAGSVIDVQFLSTGIYSTFNIYYAQLIDSNKINHTAKIDTIGHLISSIAYPYPPGDVSGLIPDTVPAGCNYYVRVVSTTGNRKPFMWGPFCIRHCDILTNNHNPVPVACLESCSKEPHGFYDTITYKIHHFDSLEHYYTGNKFQVQLISFALYPFTSFSVINTGLFGVKVDTVTGKIYLHVPCPDTLFANGINPGVYYMRIVASKSNFPDSTLGTLVYLTIGEPADSLYLTIDSSFALSPICAGATVGVIANPNHAGPPYNSTYTWWLTDRANGKKQIEQGPYAELLFYDNASDTLIVSCQEDNNTCLGATAFLPDTIIILGYPNVAKAGPLTVCLGDTGIYSIPFAKNTDYKWEISANAHSDTANNVLKIKFEATGTVRISVVAFNPCYTDSAVWSVNVIQPPLPVITANHPASTFCLGLSDTLKVSGGTTYLWSTGSKKTSIVVTPTKDSTFWVQASNKGCTKSDTQKITVHPLPDINVTYCVGDTIVMKISGANSYIWYPVTGIISSDTNTGPTVEAILPSIETYTIVGKNTFNCKNTFVLMVNPANKSGTVSGAVGIIEGESVQLKASGGSSYYWSPSAGLNSDSIQNPIASPISTTIYTVIIRSSGGCTVTDTVTVDVTSNCNIFVPEAFSPNNPNGKNTILYARNQCGLSDFDFIVFDRWGNKVFESTNENDGWDGSFKGQPMTAATFVYFATGKTPAGKTVTAKGSTALVR